MSLAPMKYIAQVHKKQKRCILKRTIQQMADIHCNLTGVLANIFVTLQRNEVWTFCSHLAIQPQELHMPHHHTHRQSDDINHILCQNVEKVEIFLTHLVGINNGFNKYDSSSNYRIWCDILLWCVIWYVLFNDMQYDMQIDRLRQ